MTVAVEGDPELSKDEVPEVQRLLGGIGHAPGPADGVWGPRTGRAFRAFLGDAGLPVTEVPTARSLRVLPESALSRDEVREVQNLLEAMGHAPGPADGRWGPRTERAFRSFLGDAALPVGPALRAQAPRALRAAASSGPKGDPRGPPGQSRTALSAGLQAPAPVQEGGATVE